MPKRSVFNPPSIVSSLAAIVSMIDSLINWKSPGQCITEASLEMQEKQAKVEILKKRQADYDLNATTKRMNHHRQETQIDKLRAEVELIQLRIKLQEKELGINQGGDFIPANYNGDTHSWE